MPKADDHAASASAWLCCNVLVRTLPVPNRCGTGMSIGASEEARTLVLPPPEGGTPVPPGYALRAGCHPLADDPRGTARLHGDAVEAVGGLHGALLVGDDEQLGFVAELVDEVEEAVEV